MKRICRVLFIFIAISNAYQCKCYADTFQNDLFIVDKLITKEKWEKAARILWKLNNNNSDNKQIKKRINKLAYLIKINNHLNQPDLVNSEYRKLLNKYNKKNINPSFLESLTIIAALANVGIKRLAEHSKANTTNSSCSGICHINVTRETWLTNLTVNKFTVEIRGDKSTGYRVQKNESGSGFLQSGNTSFYNVCSGKYKLLISGYDKYENVFSFSTDYHQFSAGTCYCNVKISSKYMNCRCK